LYKLDQTRNVLTDAINHCHSGILLLEDVVPENHSLQFPVIHFSRKPISPWDFLSVGGGVVFHSFDCVSFDGVSHLQTHCVVRHRGTQIDNLQAFI
jgi:hypothetical protein